MQRCVIGISAIHYVRLQWAHKLGASLGVVTSQESPLCRMIKPQLYNRADALAVTLAEPTPTDDLANWDGAAGTPISGCISMWLKLKRWLGYTACEQNYYNKDSNGAALWHIEEF